MTSEHEKQIRRKIVEYIWKCKFSKVWDIGKKIENETGLKILK